MDILDKAAGLAAENKWWALAALGIGVLVRLMKEDVKFFPTLPAKYRPWIAVLLGVLAGVFDKIQTGTPANIAIVGGIFAAFAAISGHQLVVESLRGGREFGETKEEFRIRSLRPGPLADAPSEKIPAPADVPVIEASPEPSLPEAKKIDEKSSSDKN